MFRRDRTGMAMVFDALVFLTIISVVSVALMNAICIQRSGSETGGYITDVHEVALACTFKGEGIVSLMTIEDLLLISMIENDTDQLEDIDRQLGKILDGYLLPLYDYHHKIVLGGAIHCFGNENVLNSEDLYVSTIEAEDESGNEIRFILSVSFA